MQKLLCNVQKFKRNAIHNVWLAMSKKWKSAALYDFRQKAHVFSFCPFSTVHLLGHTTVCKVALDQCSCSKTSGMVFCVLKGYEPLGGSLTYQVLKMNTVHPPARLEFQLSEGRVNRPGRSDEHIGRILLDCRSQLRQKGLCRKCFSLCLLSHPLALSHDGLSCSAIPSLSRSGSKWAV